MKEASVILCEFCEESVSNLSSYVKGPKETRKKLLPTCIDAPKFSFSYVKMGILSTLLANVTYIIRKLAKRLPFVVCTLKSAK